jgi:septal ring factor EnvC (AmiA/AmiB activator)
MAADPSTLGGPADLGKGLFGYRRSEVQQLLTDRDLLLVEAERRMRASQARIEELESSLNEAGRRNASMEEQLARLQAHVAALSARSAEVEKVAIQVRAEGQRVAAWRKRLQMVSTTATPTVERFGLLLRDVPNRIQEALTPLAVNAPALLARMEACAEAFRRTDSPLDPERGQPVRTEI